MKKTYLRAGVAALACALGLSACGGSSGELVLGGYIYGLTKESVTLQNNGKHDYTVTPAMLGASGEFYFPDLIGVDEQYNVTVTKWPSNVESCTVANGSGRSAFNVYNVQVTCTLKTHSIIGKITGLTSGTVVVVNGNDKKEILPGTDTFTMPTKVGEDLPYGITILSKPDNLNCTVANGTGKMGTADVTDVVISCASNTGT